MLHAAETLSPPDGAHRASLPVPRRVRSGVHGPALPGSGYLGSDLAAVDLLPGLRTARPPGKSLCQAAKTGRLAAVGAYMQAIRAHARAAVTKKELSKKSRNGEIVNWLNERAMLEADLVEIGTNLLIQTNIRKFLKH